MPYLHNEAHFYEPPKIENETQRFARAPQPKIPAMEGGMQAH